MTNVIDFPKRVYVMDAYPRRGWMVGEMIVTSTGREIRHTRLEARTREGVVAECAKLWPGREVVLPKDMP